MSELFYGWLAIGVLAFIVEMFSGTLYGLSFAFSGFILAGYVAVTGDTEITLVQAAIFAITGIVFCFLFPRWFNRSETEFKHGLDAAVGKSYPLKKVGDDWKVTIDGVDYLVTDESVTDAFAAKKKVRVDSHESGSVKVSIVLK
jgi:membrane protein implicated in regulation of membrane protease activity